MLLATLVLMLQCSMILYWARRYAERPGKAHLLLQIGALISLVGLGMRGVAVANGTAVELRYDTSNLKQSISVAIGTATVMMYSIGLVLMAKERSESRLQHLALHDVLTGTLNRRAILERFAVELDQARQQQGILAVAMIDIDHFKRVNDTYGHDIGDEVLTRVALAIKQQMGDFEFARLGGEEFGLYLWGLSTDQAQARVEQLRQATADLPGHPSVTISLGLAHLSLEGSLSEALIKADKALYSSKHNGRNRTTYSP